MAQHWRKAPWLAPLHLGGAEVPELHQTPAWAVWAQGPVNTQRLKGHKENSSKSKKLCQDPWQCSGHAGN